MPTRTSSRMIHNTKKAIIKNIGTKEMREVREKFGEKGFKGKMWTVPKAKLLLSKLVERQVFKSTIDSRKSIQNVLGTISNIEFSNLSKSQKIKEVDFLVNDYFHKLCKRNKLPNNRGLQIQFLERTKLNFSLIQEKIEHIYAEIGINRTKLISSKKSKSKELYAINSNDAFAHIVMQHGLASFSIETMNSSLDKIKNKLK